MTKELKLRSAVKKFAELMETKLRAHDHDYGPSGWTDADPVYLLKRISQELEELAAAMIHQRGVKKECADIANFAMMIASLYKD